jgi:hypothetical protein
MSGTNGIKELIRQFAFITTSKNWRLDQQTTVHKKGSVRVDEKQNFAGEKVSFLGRT